MSASKLCQDATSKQSTRCHCHLPALTRERDYKKRTLCIRRPPSACPTESFAAPSAQQFFAVRCRWFHRLIDRPEAEAERERDGQVLVAHQPPPHRRRVVPLLPRSSFPIPPSPSLGHARCLTCAFAASLSCLSLPPVSQAEHHPAVPSVSSFITLIIAGTSFTSCAAVTDHGPRRT